jgi:hypothetical protein
LRTRAVGFRAPARDRAALGLRGAVGRRFGFSDAPIPTARAARVTAPPTALTALRAALPTTPAAVLAALAAVLPTLLAVFATIVPAVLPRVVAVSAAPRTPSATVPVRPLSRSVVITPPRGRAARYPAAVSRQREYTSAGAPEGWV